MRVHLNGSLLPAEKASISVFDRGFLFGDGVYEGLRSSSGVTIGLDRHIARMRAGLDEARIRGFDAAALGQLTAELLAANGLTDAFIYWQVTRGTPLGDEGPARARSPRTPLVPTVLGFATPIASIESCTIPELRRVALRPDTRWTRGRLKSISLLGGVLAALEADDQGADDAILIRDGFVTEGTATNMFLAKGGRLITPSLESAPMLEGVTRALLLEADPSIEVRPVTEADLLGADEVMLVGTKTMVAAVTSIDGRPVGRSAQHPGPLARALLDSLVQSIAKDVRRVTQKGIGAAHV